MSSVEDIRSLIAAKGDEIRTLKAGGAGKDVLGPHITQLSDLKEQFKAANGGVPFDPPKVEAPKKVKAEVVPEAPREGLSKKELNKLARKEGRKGGAAGEDSEPSPASAPVTLTVEGDKIKGRGTEAAAPVVVAAVSSAPLPFILSPPTVNTSGGLHITYSLAQVPELCRTVAAVLAVDVSFSASAAGAPEHHAYLTLGSDLSRGSISGDVNISRYFIRQASTNGSALYGSNDPWLSSQIDQWLSYYRATRVSGDYAGVAALLNAHLELRTFIVGHAFSLADIALVLLLKRANFTPNTNDLAHVSRWFALTSPLLPFPKPLNAPKPKKDSNASSSAGKKTPANAAVAVVVETERDDETGTCPPLDGAEEGKVCTRFPPEPSGYLHIGHAKAVLLNQYYAQRYKGRLLVRFDDTNPSKEKEEYAENIIKDLETLGVKPDQVSHTSDHFATCEKIARQMIAAGTAYMDDTDQEKMQAERMEKKESYRRNTTSEENLKLFESLLKGEPAAQTFCLRAKIDMSSVNGTMRDPVLYRFNDTPHHRTGTKYKAYPTYDMACPIVDSIEGVTHALRTTEYNDRDEQYHWLQDCMGLRSVRIQSFGKMNFVNTVLSKRKLTWFVENNLVEGWFDPRFPTIQGCVRRGMNIEALKSFILSQGASRRVITMEWDKFWAENKRVMEEIAPRYMGISVQDVVTIYLENIGSEVTAHTVQIHPQKPEMGNRVLRRSNELLIDQADAKTFKAGDEVTMLRWGNMNIRHIEHHEHNPTVVKAIYATFNAEATNFSKTKKLTWLANVPDLVPCRILEFDHLISKAKLTEEDKFQDFVNPNSRSESSGLVDACLRTVEAGSVIQLERKGFFRVDQAYGGSPSKPAVLFAIPDGKVKK